LIVVSLAPLLGPCFGPLFGSGVSSDLQWPFAFWLLGVIGLVLEVALFFLPETYVPVITARTKPKEAIPSQDTWRQRARAFFVVNLGRPVSIRIRLSTGKRASD
jgi:MFS transporter, DHA1 family, multidrug resistance protein